jgi:signal peptidase I
MSKEKQPLEQPSLDQLEAELKRSQYKRKYGKTVRSTLFSLVVVAAIAVLVATLWMPVLRISGSSMVPTLSEGQVVITVKTSNLQAGDIVAFYQGNKLLIKRYIAGPGQWVNIDAEGNVSVDGELLDEPYLVEKAYGETNIELPYQVPENRYFLMGDNRDVSVDSRNTSVGAVAEDQVVGKVVFRIWPLSEFGPVS